MQNFSDSKMLVLGRLAFSSIIIVMVMSGKIVECRPKSESASTIYCNEAGSFTLFPSTFCLSYSGEKPNYNDLKRSN